MPRPETCPVVLMVDDEGPNTSTFARVFRRDYRVRTASSAEEALRLLELQPVDVVITDYTMPGMSGLELLQRVRAFDPAIPVIIMTAHGTIEGAVEAMKLGAFDYLKKPVDLVELKLLADRARETSQLKQELSYYRRRATRDVPLAGVLGESPAIRTVLEQVRQIAALEETPPVLITGETGTGKGLVARTIHTSSPRSARSFIEVNCTALPATLMEAELFGYERGAFTDAKESKMGLFEAAEGGYLFLDEVGDVELSLQGKLLRAIEERVVRRVGGIRDRKVDVRILAATNRDLEREVQQERFRKDLYFRLAVILLRLPPLRERGGDVLLLAEHFLRRYSAKYGKAVRGIDARARELLLAYPWPGNVRELSHVIERAVLWSQGPALEAEHLSLVGPAEPTPARGAPLANSPEPTPQLVSDSGAPAGLPTLPPPGTDLEQWERSILEQAMNEAGGNQTKAAQRLGISRDTLRYRLKKHGIQP